MQAKHGLGLCRKEEVLCRDPRRKLLLDGEIALIVLRYFAIVAVSGVLEVPLTDLHALSKNDLFWSYHLQHVSVRRYVPVRLESPETLMRTTAMVFHEFL